MATVKKRGRQVDIDVQRAIEQLALADWEPARIQRYLSRMDRFSGRVPQARTVQRIVKDVRPRDTSGAWTLAEAEPESARVVLDVLAAVIDYTGGYVHRLTRAVAEWVVRLHHAAPDLPPVRAWLLARVYLARAAREDSTADLDILLAMAPWRSGEDGWARYDELTATGEVPRVPTFLAESGGNPWRTLNLRQDFAEADALWSSLDQRTRQHVAWLSTPQGKEHLQYIADQSRRERARVLWRWGRTRRSRARLRRIRARTTRG